MSESLSVGRALNSIEWIKKAVGKMKDIAFV
jgi:hypothetical protein